MRKELTRMIMDELINEADQAFINSFLAFRKNPTKNQIIADLSDAGAESCFYEGRGLGQCSTDVSLDRIIPGSQGGEYSFQNCVLSCSFHNSQRGDQDFSQYINSGGCRA